jgi:hypothetical protein
LGAAAVNHRKSRPTFVHQHHGAIPTNDSKPPTLQLDVIGGHVEDLNRFATDHPEVTFLVAASSCGLEWYKVEEKPRCSLGPPFDLRAQTVVPSAQRTDTPCHGLP